MALNHATAELDAVVEEALAACREVSGSARQELRAEVDGAELADLERRVADHFSLGRGWSRRPDTAGAAEDPLLTQNVFGLLDAIQAVRDGAHGPDDDTDPRTLLGDAW